MRGRELSLARPLLMGILNVTPDSFSDGGAHLSPDDAALAALEMLKDGADIIDVGGESTRPGATPVDEATEKKRVVPAVKAIRRVTDAPISVDTRRAGVARAALRAGADAINDVSALADPAMAGVVAKSGAGLVLMHGYAAHAADGNAAGGADVAAEVRDFLAERIAAAEAAGIGRECIVADPGVGFAKDTAANVAVLRALPDLAAALRLPLLVGLSRKRFIGEITHVRQPEERVSGSVAAMLWALWHGASVLRMHDVRAAREAIDIATAIS